VNFIATLGQNYSIPQVTKILDFLKFSIIFSAVSSGFCEVSIQPPFVQDFSNWNISDIPASDNFLFCLISFTIVNGGRKYADVTVNVWNTLFMALRINQVT